MLSAGIVGLPNVGKSTLFNAVTRTHKAPAENYPFCTIDPNVGMVTVPDPRLDKIAEISHSKKITPTAIQFVTLRSSIPSSCWLIWLLCRNDATDYRSNCTPAKRQQRSKMQSSKNYLRISTGESRRSPRN